MNRFFLIGLIILSGCDIFDTRVAEQPSQPRSNFINAVKPEDVLTNMVNSLQDLNSKNYLACFTDTSFSNRQFSFAASSTALSQFPQMAEGWGKNEEAQYFLNMINRISDEKQITLNLSNPLFGSPQGDSLIFTASYSLSVPHNEKNIPTVFEGDLSFNMLRDSRKIWSIYFWRDTKSNELPTWSELKGRFY